MSFFVFPAAVVLAMEQNIPQENEEPPQRIQTGKFWFVMSFKMR